VRGLCSASRNGHRKSEKLFFFFTVYFIFLAGAPEWISKEWETVGGSCTRQMQIACVCVCMCVCVCVSLCVYIHMNVCVCVCIYIYTYTHIYTYMDTPGTPRNTREQILIREHMLVREHILYTNLFVVLA
jgi:hypothetical protein